VSPAYRVAAAIATIRGYAALCVAAVMVAACSTQHASDAATASPSVSSPSPANSSPATAAGAVSFPSQLLGRDKNSSAAAEKVISSLDKEYVSTFTAILGGTGKGAIYGDEQNGFFIVIAAKAQKQIASPDTAVRDIQNDWASSGVTDLNVFPGGSNGQETACQQTPQQDVVCFWADHLSIGITLYTPGLASGLKDGASKTIQIRSAVVH
jgi:hypothetical protein